MFLSKETKKNQNEFFQRTLGVSYDELMTLDVDDVQRLIHENASKKEFTNYQRFPRMDGTPVKQNKIKQKSLGKLS